jgi:ring-1,2-phenylacetyl-CoA epoxidase subunit PaaE
MSLHFHPLTVAAVRKETADCVSVSLSVPAALQEIFHYQHGQYLTVRANINGEEVRRSYSICSSPLDHELRIAVKKVENGKFSTWANQSLKKGDTLDVMPPMGKFFTKLDVSATKNYLGFAAGSGITPLLSIIKTTLRTEPNSQFTLVYGNRHRHSIIFREELEALKNQYMQRLRLVHILSREKTDTVLHAGRIDGDKCRQLFDKVILPDTIDECFLCGPETMILSVKETLIAAGIDAKKIHFELFTTAGSQQASAVNRQSSVVSGPVSKVTLKLDGVAVDFDLPYDGSSILDAALSNGADLPYACKGGVCCTCRAKLMEGEVKMDINYGLEPDEIEQGFILTCQAHPLTEKVVVDFDIR